ncbi:hypothetical protein B0H16DRAFT_1665514 [Mycena metata]|uniref:DUF4419 domain-containing protein n=1 Tax=Mycena metata TaxID=1033252 RepID=A0AAD7HTZ4_9AGAR|nr:hypothetical protein B0H16DRAFT_1665514 [Mycena metata]
MPITFSVASHPANPLKIAHNFEGYTAKEILAGSCRQESANAKDILQFGFSGVEQSGSRDSTGKILDVFPDRNGFIGTAIQAYNEHRALVIRPDDVWLAILCQFNFFVNANAELLRANFVAHEGKQDLVIEADIADFASMARRMVGEIEKNVVDPTLREWVVPNFTTTTDTDRTVGAVLMMATLKEFFSYTFATTACGIPRVTLEGEKSDWVNILARLEKLKEYGIETIAWYHLLRPVITRFVAAFDTPTSEDNVEFWQKIAHYHSMGSGPSYYSGWINAFNIFSEKASSSEALEEMSAQPFWATYTKVQRLRTSETLVFDDTPYHYLDTARVPVGYADVGVKWEDDGGSFDCTMVAGSIGTRVASSKDLSLSSTGENDVVSPVVGWWIFTKKEAA